MRLRDCMLAVIVTLCVCACGAMHDTRQLDAGSDSRRAVDTNIGLSEQYIESKDYEAALDKLQKALRIDGSSAAAYSMLGLLYERINRPQLAEQNYAKSARLAPDKGAIQNNYAQWLCHSGHPAESDAYFRKALDDPFYKTPAAALSNAGACALMAGKLDVSETYYRQLLALDANNVDALQQLAALLYQRGDYLRARAFMERRVNAGEANPRMLDLAARIEDKLGDRDAADGYRKRLVSEFPQYTSGQL
jgi:type IV pilus assembly protein PilF